MLVRLRYILQGAQKIRINVDIILGLLLLQGQKN